MSVSPQISNKVGKEPEWDLSQMVDTKTKVKIIIPKVIGAYLQDPLPVCVMGDDNHPDPAQRRVLSYEAKIPLDVEVSIPRYALPALDLAIQNTITFIPMAGGLPGETTEVRRPTKTVTYQIIG